MTDTQAFYLFYLSMFSVTTSFFIFANTRLVDPDFRPIKKKLIAGSIIFGLAWFISVPVVILPVFFSPKALPSLTWISTLPALLLPSIHKRARS